MIKVVLLDDNSSLQSLTNIKKCTYNFYLDNNISVPFYKRDIKVDASYDNETLSLLSETRYDELLSSLTLNNTWNLFEINYYVDDYSTPSIKVSFDPRLNLTKIVNYILELKINNELIIDSLFINFEKITKSSDLITNKILSDNLVPSNHTIVSEIANSEKCHLLSESLTYLKSNDKAIMIKGNLIDDGEVSVKNIPYAYEIIKYFNNVDYDFFNQSYINWHYDSLNRIFQFIKSEPHQKFINFSGIINEVKNVGVPILVSTRYIVTSEEIIYLNNSYIKNSTLEYKRVIRNPDYYVFFNNSELISYSRNLDIIKGEGYLKNYSRYDLEVINKTMSNPYISLIHNNITLFKDRNSNYKFKYLFSRYGYLKLRLDSEFEILSDNKVIYEELGIKYVWDSRLKSSLIMDTNLSKGFQSLYSNPFNKNKNIDKVIPNYKILGNRLYEINDNKLQLI
jgi:hypothetical protein